MATLYALLVAPVLALADQVVALSLTVWACRGQHGLAIHVVHAAFALAVAPAIVLAWMGWRETGDRAPLAAEASARHHFLAGMSIGVAALSLLVIVAMWFPTWLLSSCLE